MRLFHLLFALLLAALLSASSVAAQAPQPAPPRPPEASGLTNRTAFDALASMKNTSMLAWVLQVQAKFSPDFAKVLQGPGPITFFAPTNEAFHRNSQRFREVLEGARANASTQVNVSLPSLPSTIDIPTKKLWRQGQQQQRQQQQQQQIAQEEDEGTRSHANGLPATVAAAADAADPIAALSLYFQQTVPGVPAPPPGVPAPPSPPAPPPGLPHLPNLPNFPPPNIPSLPGNASITVIDPRKFGQLLKIFDALMHYHVSPGIWNSAVAGANSNVLFLPSMLNDSAFVKLGGRPQVLKLVRGSSRMFLNGTVAESANATAAANATTVIPIAAGNTTAKPHSLQANVTAASALDWRIEFLKHSLKYSNESGLAAARIIAGDIVVSNGVIHLIDDIVGFPLPLELTLRDANLTDYAALIQNTNSNGTIEALGGSTIFAATDAAFSEYAKAAPLGTPGAAQQPAAPAQPVAVSNQTSQKWRPISRLQQNQTVVVNQTVPSVVSSFPLDRQQALVQSSVVKGVYYSTNLSSNVTLKALNGENLALVNITDPATNRAQWIIMPANATGPAGANVTISANDTSPLLFTDLLFDGGVIHIISRVHKPSLSASVSNASASNATAPVVVGGNATAAPVTRPMRRLLQVTNATAPPPANATAPPANASGPPFAAENSSAVFLCDSQFALVHMSQRAHETFNASEAGANATAPPVQRRFDATSSWFSSLFAEQMPFPPHQPPPPHPTPQRPPPEEGRPEHGRRNASLQIPRCPPRDHVCVILPALPQVCQSAYQQFRAVNVSHNATLAGNATAAGNASAPAAAPPAAGNRSLQQGLLDASARFNEELSKHSLRVQCYNPATHVCSAGSYLCPRSAPNQCGGLCYSAANYTCTNHFTLCPIKNPQDCNGACYASEYYACANGQLQQHANATHIANGPTPVGAEGSAGANATQT